MKGNIAFDNQLYFLLIASICQK